MKGNPRMACDNAFFTRANDGVDRNESGVWTHMSLLGFSDGMKHIYIYIYLYIIL
jgi:hypothetical protein